MSRAFPLCRDGEHRLRVRPLPNARASTSMLARGPVRCARRSRCDHAIAAHPGCSPTSKLAQCEATGHPIAICAVFESASGLVRAENLVHGSDQHGCSFGRPAVMISDHVAAVRGSPVYAGRRGVAAVAARGGVEDRGDLDPAPPARGAQRRQPRRPKLNWADPALLAALLSVIPKARRQGLRLLVAPETIVRWHRDVVRRRWGARSTRGRTSRPVTRRNVQALVRRLARENPGWGYRRIHGERAGLGVGVAASTVWEILKASGIDPGRRPSGPTWSQIPALPGRGDPSLRLLHRRPARRYAGLRPGRNRARDPAHPHPRRHPPSHRRMDGPAGPQPPHGPCEQAHRARFLIRDRGSNFTAAFDAVLTGAGIRTVLCNIQTPG
jgi:hypothetical protein